jgi:hypothetical protein
VAAAVGTGSTHNELFSRVKSKLLFMRVGDGASGASDIEHLLELFLFLWRFRIRSICFFMLILAFYASIRASLAYRASDFLQLSACRSIVDHTRLSNFFFFDIRSCFDVSWFVYRKESIQDRTREG